MDESNVPNELNDSKDNVVDPESWTQRKNNVRTYNVFKRREHKDDKTSELYARVQGTGGLRGVNRSQKCE
jgi:hypothetical protein